MAPTAAAEPASNEQHFILSTSAPSAAQKSLAVAVVCGILVVYFSITLGPFRGVHLDRVDAFVPTYVTAMLVFDSLTALLLYAQFAIVRSRATLVVASAYLFAALVMVPFILVFPGVFVPGRGLLGGLQSTSWLYFFQHAGFPLFIIGYALLKDENAVPRSERGTALADIAGSVASTVTVVAGGAVLFIAGEPYLLRVTLDTMNFGPLWWYPATVVALLNVAAIVVLWSRRRVALDLWLMVVTFLYAVEIPLSYYPDPRRFSLGWYAVRVFGTLSSSIVLILLIQEISTLYARLLSAVVGQRREREARLMTGDAVAAAIAHEVRQPLTAMVTTADAGLRYLDRSLPNLDKAKEAFQRISADGHRAGTVIEGIRASFRNDVRDWTRLDLNELVGEALTLARADLQEHGIVVHSEAPQRLPLVLGNRVQLQQVLLNLVMNAVDAMAGSPGPRILRVTMKGSDNDRIVVSVADTGTGIGALDAGRIFDPLFTTKPGGMGMGLSICRAIVEAHEGRLAFAPNAPRGATFQFSLQALPADAAPA